MNPCDAISLIHFWRNPRNHWLPARYRTGSGSDRVKDSTFVMTGNRNRSIVGKSSNYARVLLDPPSWVAGSRRYGSGFCTELFIYSGTSNKSLDRSAVELLTRA